MKNIYLVLFTMACVISTNAQTVAMDFTQDDCNGNPHQLFTELDQNNVVIIEFFMTNCTPCINAGNALKPHVEEMMADYPDHVKWYHFGFNNNYDCTTVSEWVTSNDFPSTPFINGADMVAYYGGFGMPTIVVLAGANHEIIYSEVGYSSGDDELVHTAIDDYFVANPLTVSEQSNNAVAFSAVYLAAQELLNINVSKGFGAIEVTLLSSDGKVALQTNQYKVVTADNTVALETNQLANGVYIISVKNDFDVVSKHISINR